MFLTMRNTPITPHFQTLRTARAVWMSRLAIRKYKNMFKNRFYAGVSPRCCQCTFNSLFSLAFSILLLSCMITYNMFLQLVWWNAGCCTIKNAASDSALKAWLHHKIFPPGPYYGLTGVWQKYDIKYAIKHIFIFPNCQTTHSYSSRCPKSP